MSDSGKTHRTAEVKVTFQLSPWFNRKIKNAVILLEQNGEDEVEIPDGNGQRLIKQNTPAAAIRETQRNMGMILIPYSSGGKKYFVSIA